MKVNLEDSLNKVNDTEREPALQINHQKTSEFPQGEDNVNHNQGTGFDP